MPKKVSFAYVPFKVQNMNEFLSYILKQWLPLFLLTVPSLLIHKYYLLVKSVSFLIEYQVAVLYHCPHCGTSLPSQADLKDKDLKDKTFEGAELLFVPAAVSGINLLLPGFFNICAWIENYNSPGVRVHVSIFRWEKELQTTQSKATSFTWDSKFLSLSLFNHTFYWVTPRHAVIIKQKHQ